MRILALILLILSGVHQAIAQPVADFASDTSAGCTPVTVYFQNQSSNAVIYEWTFGNGATSSVENPAITFNTPGSYSVKLVVEDQNGDKDSLEITDYIMVSGGPTANFTYNQTGNCENDHSVQFNNQSLNADSVMWYFGDGNTSTEWNPIHHYGLDGSFTVTLTAVDSVGCSDNFSLNTQPIVIDPVANSDISVDTTQWCGLNHTFSIQASSQNSQITSASWNLDDGSTVFGNSITHQFQQDGTYQPYVIVENNHGCVDTSFAPVITVHPEAAAVVNVSQDTVCLPAEVDFTTTNLSNPIWMINGQNAAASSSFTKNFTSQGSYIIELQGTDSNGCPFGNQPVDTVIVNETQNIAFNVNSTIGCAPLSTTFDAQTGLQNYQWKSGGTILSTQQSDSTTFSQPGSYNLKLIYVDQNGCTGDTVTNIQVNGPDINVTSSGLTGCVPHTVNFQSQITNASTFEWHFGDGTTSIQPNPSHVYGATGTHDVFLTATDMNGCTDTAFIPGQVTAFDISDSLNFAVDSSRGCAPYEKQFNASGIGNGYWQWEFGDGSTSAAQFPVHTYTTPGTYVVGLSTNTLSGCSLFIDTLAVVIVDELMTNITTTVQGSCPFPEIVMNSSGVNDSTVWNILNDTMITADSIAFNMGTGTGSTLVETHLGGCKDETLEIFGVICPPSGGAPSPGGTFVNNSPIIIDYAELHPAPLCTPYELGLQSPYISAVWWFWDFGDGTVSNIADPNHTYSTPGSYTITHRAANAQGDTVELYVVNVHVKQSPSSPFNLDLQSGCYTLDAMVHHDIPDSTTVDWIFDYINVYSGDSASHTIPQTQQVLNISMIASHANGCLYEKDTIVGIPQEAINVNYNNVVCYDDTVFFTVSSNYNYSYEWLFGDSTSTITSSDSTAHVYHTGGNFQPKLIIHKSNNCSDTLILQDQVEVTEPQTGFTSSATDICIGERVNFYANQTGPAVYQWLLKPPTGYRYGADPYMIYNHAGTFDVWLQVTQNGCVKRDTVQNYITVHEVDADFTSTQNHTCLPIEVTFTNQTANTVDWKWAFGTGDSAFIENPVYSFASIPADSITFVAIDSFGCSDTSRQWVIEALNLDFSASDTTGCGPLTVDFTNASTGTNWWIWDFGDGTTSSAFEPSHQYTAEGDFTVKLIAGSSSSCADTLIYTDYIHIEKAHAQGSVTAQGFCNPVIADFSAQNYPQQDVTWTFGDGNTANINSPTHIYSSNGTYTPLLIAETPLGCIDSMWLSDIDVISPVIDSVDASGSGCAPLNVQFGVSTASQANYNWTFGNGTTGSGSSPTTTYTNPGTYDVNITATDSLGCSTTLYLDSVINVFGNPSMDIHLNDSSLCIGENFIAIDSSFSNGSILWNMGDGTQYTGPSVQHTYANKGLYTIQIMRSTPNGCADSGQVNVTVHGIPETSFPELDSALCPPVLINPTSNTQNSYDELWILDGDTLDHTLPVSLHNPGSYELSLIVSTPQGCSSTSQRSFTLLDNTPLPPAEITRSTVVDDAYVLTEWMIPDSIKNINNIWLYRGTHPDSLHPVEQLPPYQNEYLDPNVDVHEETYYYEITLVNTCAVHGEASNHGSNIVLEAKRANEAEVILKWTPYQEWSNGVDSYLIQRRDEYGNWETVRVVDGQETQVIIKD